MDFESNIKEDLHKYLVSQTRIDEHRPECPDLEEWWPTVARAYLPDGLREFKDYPVTSLGWIMFVGMALAKYWDVDWEKFSKEGGAVVYASLRDARGFDNLDDYVLQDVLGVDEKEGEEIMKVVAECAQRTYAAIMKSGLEPGTQEAMKLYVAALHQLYLMGIGMELNALGYHMTQLQ